VIVEGKKKPEGRRLRRWGTKQENLLRFFIRFREEPTVNGMEEKGSEVACHKTGSLGGNNPCMIR